MDDRPDDASATLPPAGQVFPPSERIGDKYKLLPVIGEGGMGLVYLGEQEKPVRRRVAIKLIKPGLETKEVLARFASEDRQAFRCRPKNIDDRATFTPDGARIVSWAWSNNADKGSMWTAK